MKIRILIVTTNFPPFYSIGTQRILKICKYIDKKIFDILILTQKSEKHAQEKIYNQYAEPIRKRISVFRAPKIDINKILIDFKKKVKRKPQSQNGKGSSRNNSNIERKSSPGLFSLISDLLEYPDKEIIWLPFAFLKGLLIIFKYKINIIFSSSPKHSMHLISYLLSKLTNRGLVIEFRDPWARSPWHQQIRSSNFVERMKHKGIQYFERLVVEHASKVVCVTDKLAEDFQKFYNTCPESKFISIYNGFDPDTRVVKSTPNEKVIFSHIGALYKKRNPFPIVKAVENLLFKKPELENKFIIQCIGSISSDFDSVLSMIKTNSRLEQHIKIRSQVDTARSYELMSESDCLILLQPGTKTQLPGKFFDYLNMAKPILALGEKNSEVENMVNHKFGVFCDYSDTRSIEDAIYNFIEETYRKKYISKIKKNRDKFDFKDLILRLENVFAE